VRASTTLDVCESVVVPVVALFLAAAIFAMVCALPLCVVLVVAVVLVVPVATFFLAAAIFAIVCSLLVAILLVSLRPALILNRP
jgi:hypothetical protein